VVSFPTSAQATAGPATRVALTSRQEAARPLRIWFREMAPGSTDRPASRWQCLARMRDLGLKTNPIAPWIASPEQATARYDRKEIRAGEHVIVERAGDGLTTGTVTSDGRASA
jgi:NAD-dependent DNA ligase